MMPAKRVSASGLPASPSTGSTLSALLGSSNGAASSSSAAASSSGTNITSVQVAVRIRPVTEHDQASIPARWQRSVITVNSANSLTVDASGPPPPGSAPAAATSSARDKRLQFAFDRVLSPADGQDAVYKSSASALIPKFLEGYNVTILAYGQTSSGKSYTMGTSSSDSIDFEGLVAGRAPDPDMGIIPRAVAQIFDAVNAQKARSGAIQYTIKASFIEIYNEDLIDLLADADGDARPLVQIREDKAGHIFWSGLREVKVNNVADVMNYLVQGSAVRRTNETDMNAQSSRSHAIFSLTMTQRKCGGSGPAPPPVASSGSGAAALANSALNGRTTPTGRASTSGLPRPSSSLGRSTPTGFPSASAGRASVSGLRTPNTLLSGSRSQSPVAGGGAGLAAEERMRGLSGVLGTGEGEWTTVVSKFHFVDLAGSERLKRTAAQGERIKEGISINSGLHALGNVISALGDPVKARKTTHIPYRDSKLTRLLQDSLGGNAHTLMIACVSPTEYNVGETVNTLQYANRARNIKNKAELNEQEIGWDDLDYLQGQVTKLRKELAVLKSSKGSGSTAALRGIADDDKVKKLEATVRQLNDRQSTDQVQIAVLKRELKAREHQKKDSDFLQAAEPIILEYEKAIDVLEGQINLMKAALGHSEDIINEHESKIVEQDERINLVEQQLDARESTIVELQTRLSQLQDRESSANTYATELEARLQSYSNKEDADSGMASELRKEVVRLRQAESSAEAYIKELEKRLLASDSSLAQLTAQVERLERDLERRDEQYRELLQRLDTLDITVENKALLEELDARDQRVLELEKRLDTVVTEKEALARDKGNLTDAVARDQLERGKLEDRIRQLEKNAADPVADAAANPNAAVAADGNGVPVAGDVHFAELQSEMLLLRDSHAKTLAELSTVQVRHREALQDIEKLSGQIAEAKLTRAAAAPDEEMEELSPPVHDPHTDGDDSCSSPTMLSPSRRRDSWQVSPSRAGGGAMRRPESLRLDSGSSVVETLQRRSSGSFLGYKPADSQPEVREMKASGGGMISKTNGNHHVRTRSMSSGQSFVGELSRGPRPLSLSGTVPPSPFFKAIEPDSPANYERKILSLEKERDQLQAILKEREDELDAVQRSSSVASAPASAETVTESKSLSSELASASEAQLVDGEAPTTTTTSSPAAGASTPALSQAVEAQLEALQQVLAESGNNQQSLQVQQLLLSFAKKENSHREQTEYLKSELEAAHKEREALDAASHEMVGSLTSELEALRAKLKEAEKAHASTLANVSTVAESSKHDTARLQDEHKLALSVLSTKHDAASQEQNAIQARALEDKSVQHQSALSALAEKHSNELARLSSEHADVLSARKAEHEQALARLKDEHERALAWKDEQHASALSNANLEQESRDAEGQEERESLLKRLREEHASQLERTKSEYELLSQRSLAAAAESHSTAQKEDIAAALADRAKEYAAVLDAKEQEHLSTLTDLSRQHSETLLARDAQYEDALNKALTSLSREHSANVQELTLSHTEALIDATAAHATQLEEKDKELREAVARTESAATAAETELRMQHESALSELRDQHDKALAARQEKHEKALSETNATHEREKSELVEAHKAAIDRLEQEHNTKLEGWEDTHNQFLNELKTQQSQKAAEDASAIAAAHQEEMKQLHASLGQKTQAHETELAALRTEHEDKLTRIQEELQTVSKERDNLREANTEFEKRHRLLQSQLEVDPVEMDMLKAELAETSDALVVLEAALTEAQAERDQVATELAVLRDSMERENGLHTTNASSALAKELETQRSLLSQARNDLLRSKADLQALSEERTRQDMQLRDTQMKLAAAESRAGKARDSLALLTMEHSPVMDGLVNGHRSASRTGMRTSQEIEQLSDGGSRSFARAGQAGSKPPPPTPPPNMPPPPTPTGGNVNARSSTGTRSSSSSARPDSIEGALTRSSSTASLSNGSSSTVAPDPRSAKVMAEQAEELQKLTKQLAHCEADLQANIDLVATLEAALNDSERNLRKSRVQLSEITRERDRFSAQADELQMQVKKATAEVERVRNSVILEKQDYESKIQEERQAKEKAREALEARLEEVSRKKHSSRLFCM
ncbi:kinesin-domain-containing protein [Tilletiaria anomala UBC 951]|uniref:Kinesin-domain-containing protein n=1 Tax=Tilletiaria anomala (strain ATCC 24038 / CBS 436.72 / UBC 951) TaxID=1037660 RepID=A0A066WFE1_TILAU|nr:kinesin-domain-containing protein [Tilletiaria anomala UBC 951]KDN52496.1 kinesin-domain-containing protein [Tilletiaria anomala UBC 951]